ncbi:IclR family transcriptional regulator [Inquilinus sp. OTU3971]|uniref:IclR family transcriptional regulator n=1 Tax=Inquilinus sp. OTU3971 TaxID=3043855 RepID=UPI00313CA784
MTKSAVPARTRKAKGGQTPMAPAVLKACGVLAEIARATGPMTAGDLARQLELPKSTVVDICQTLVELDHLRRDQDFRFALGGSMVRISRGLFLGFPLLETFDRAIQAVDQPSHRTVVMATLDGSDIAVTAVHHGRIVLPITATVGLYLPAWTTASGHALLSEHSIGELSGLLSAPSATAMGVPGEVPAAEELFERIARQKERGYFVDFQQTAVGMRGVSAPLFLPGVDKPVAAVTVATIDETGSAEAEIELLGDMARRIVRQTIRLSSDVRK